MVSSGYGCHPDEEDFTCKFMHPHGHTENNYVTCQYGDYWRLALVMDVNPDEKDFTCKLMHPHGHTENNYVTCQYGDYWWLALVMDVIQMRRTSLVSLCIHMATQRTTMSPANMETTGG